MIYCLGSAWQDIILTPHNRLSNSVQEETSAEGAMSMRRQLTAKLQRIAHPHIWHHAHEMMSRQWLDPAENQKLHDEKLSSVLRHAITHVPRYVDLAESKGWRVDKLSHENLSEFPLVDKVALTENQSTFFADDARPEDRVADATGGSSGVWFGFYYDRRQKEIRRATHFYSRILAGWRPGDKLAIVWGHRGDVAATTGLKQKLVDSILFRQITLNAYNMDDQILEQYAERLEKHQPRILVGYASSLAFLAGYLGRRGSHKIGRAHV